MIRPPLLAAALSLFATLASAETVATPGELRKVTDEIMEQVGAGEVQAGLKLMKPYTIIPAAEFDAMAGQAELQLPMISKRFGESIGYEFIREDRVGENLIQYVYIHRFEKHAMRWMFYCYRGNSGWVINSFMFDDKLPAIFP